MLTPTKHTNIKYSIVYISGIILKILQENSILKYDELKQLVIENSGIKTKARINISLTFLFAIHKIEYLKELDAIILINEH
jgi:hypothetical protein